jgi:hypothetical protein
MPHIIPPLIMSCIIAQVLLGFWTLRLQYLRPVECVELSVAADNLLGGDVVNTCL